MPNNSSKKPLSTINERLKFLIELLNMSARAFSTAIEMPDSNTRNYLNKGTKLSSDYLENIASHFSHVNLSWLITGNGEAFLDGELNQTDIQQANTKPDVSSEISSAGPIANKNLHLAAYQRDLEFANKEIEHLRQQIQLQRDLLASKEETIALLRASRNRLN